MKRLKPRFPWKRKLAMNSKSRPHCSVLMCLIAAQMLWAEPPQRTAEELLAIYGPGFTLRVVDENDQFEGAIAGIFAQMSEDKWHLGCNKDARLTDERGEVKLPHGQNQLDGGCVVAWHDGRMLAGIKAATPNQLSEDGIFKIAVRPARRVQGRVTCIKLKPSGEAFGWTNVYVHAGDERPVGYSSYNGEYEFLLPEGDYDLQAYGEYVHHVRRPLHVDLEGEALVVDPIDLPPTQLALLRGKPAPRAARASSDGRMRKGSRSQS